MLGVRAERWPEPEQSRCLGVLRQHRCRVERQQESGFLRLHEQPLLSLVRKLRVGPLKLHFGTMSTRFILRLVALSPLWEAWGESKQGKTRERLGELRVEQLCMKE